MKSEVPVFDAEKGRLILSFGGKALGEMQLLDVTLPEVNLNENRPSQPGEIHFRFSVVDHQDWLQNIENGFRS